MRIEPLVLATLVTLAPLLACKGAKKVSECNSFIERVNTGIKEVEAATKGEDAASFEKAAATYEKLGSDVGAMSFDTPELKAHAASYRAMCDSAAKTLREVSAALTKEDIKAATDAQGDFAVLEKQENELVAKINGFCTAQ